jgi:hypothetical protein
MTIYTVHLQGHDGTGVVDYYLADDAYNTSPTDDPPNQHFRPTLKVPATFEQSVDPSGKAQIGFGQIVIVNADGRYDCWRDIAFDGRPCVVKALDDKSSRYADADVAIDGVVEDIDIGDAYTTVKVRLYDRLLDLDKPLLTERYGGTTLASGPTADGDESLAGALIKRCYGDCPAIELDLVNRFDLIYQASDGPVTSIAASDGGLYLTAGANYTTLAALQAASIAPGHYATALDTPDGAFVRLGSQPILVLTFDVVAGASAEDRSPAAIARQILDDFGITDVDEDSFAALHEAAPGVAGLRVDSDATAKALLEQILTGVTGWCLPDALGRFAVGRIAEPAAEPAAEFAEWQLRGQVQSLDPQDGQAGIPVWRVVTRYRYIGRPHTAAELEGAVSSERRAWLLGPNAYREVVSEDPTIKARWLRAGELILETRFINAADAQAEGDRVLALRKVKRRRWQFAIEEEYGRALQLVDTVRLTMSRFMPTGQNLIVLRKVKEFVSKRMTIDVWG